MLKIKGAAELKNINVRAEIHGEELVRAIDLKLVMVDADASKLETVVPGLMAKFWNGKQPTLQELYPLKVRHKIENADAVVRVGRKRVVLREVIVQKIAITPLFSGRCQIAFSMRCKIGDGVLDPLHKGLRGTVHITIEERQMELPAMDQKADKKVAGNGRKRPLAEAQDHQPTA